MISVKREQFQDDVPQEYVEFVVENDENFINIQEVYDEQSAPAKRRSRRKRQSYAAESIPSPTPRRRRKRGGGVGGGEEAEEEVVEAEEVITMATVLSSGGGAVAGGGEMPLSLSAVSSQQQSDQCTVAAITVVTAAPNSSAASNTLIQNGKLETVLGDSGDSSDDGSTIQVTVSAGGGGGSGGGDDSDGGGGGVSQGGGVGGGGGGTTTASIVDSAHYITVTVPDTDTVTADGVAHSAYVQYVESAPDQTIYTTTNGQMAYPVYTVGESGTMYTPASGQYYTPGNTTPVTYSQVAGGALNGPNQGGTAAQLLGSTYLIQQTVDGTDTIITSNRSSPQTVSADVTYHLVNSAAAANGPGGGTVGSTAGGGGATSVPPGSAANANPNGATLDSDQPSLIHATRVSPATVQWLLENYETAEGVSLARVTLYNHYLRHCYEHKLDPVNAASFGKLIRSVFLGLRTRRLGTRGNSKYHYYGIRVKPGSPLNQLPMMDDEGRGAMVGGGNGNGGGGGGGNGGNGGGGRASTGAGGGGGQKQQRYNKFGGAGAGKGGDGSVGNQAHAHECGGEQNHQHNNAQSNNHEFLGDGTRAIPDFPNIVISHVALPEDCTLEDVDTFRSIYREHCEAFLDAILSLEFATVESLWREFWRSQDNNNGEECEEEKYLSKTKLYLLCKCLPIQQFVRKVDYLFYQNLVQVLIPDVLRPIPSSLTQSIRNFAKGLESWLSSAMLECPQQLLNIKVNAVGAFAQTLRRYTSLNHLAQAARAVLQNSAQIGQMLTDLNRVDFHNVQEQASWVCECDSALVQRLETNFKATLQQQNSLEEWASWLKGVVAAVLKPYEGKPNYTKAARQFLLKWSFYSSMVIRDLTLRSAASFGSFHLIRLLYDEYMFYLIEHQVALATGETPIAVMGEKCDSPAGGGVVGGGGGGGVIEYHHQMGGGGGEPACNGGISLNADNALYVSCSDLHLSPKRAKIS
ncbi:DNA-binding protein RFX2 isoform X2 [Nilaparvata lugens]|uniref:DNA-binding protein RFX2 isoform X2 n=1 Tax=Nilaparvata lugens TaxID=108931 RepID=UPI00193CFE1A|nr:DNA-binding protein RFX2 isoform X2 [Nilaparvata lugens]